METAIATESVTTKLTTMTVETAKNKKWNTISSASLTGWAMDGAIACVTMKTINESLTTATSRVNKSFVKAEIESLHI